MPTQVEYDAAFAAAMPIIRREIANEETEIPVFFRTQVVSQITAHEAQIEVVVKEILRAGLDAAEQARGA